jgi:hypothetical protein
VDFAWQSQIWQARSNLCLTAASGAFGIEKVQVPAEPYAMNGFSVNAQDA